MSRGWPSLVGFGWSAAGVRGDVPACGRPLKRPCDSLCEEIRTAFSCYRLRKRMFVVCFQLWFGNRDRERPVDGNRWAAEGWPKECKGDAPVVWVACWMATLRTRLCQTLVGQNHICSVFLPLFFMRCTHCLLWTFLDRCWLLLSCLGCDWFPYSSYLTYSISSDLLIQTSLSLHITYQ